jgi:hypothetical protein
MAEKCKHDAVQKDNICHVQSIQQLQCINYELFVLFIYSIEISTYRQYSYWVIIPHPLSVWFRIQEKIVPNILPF